MFFKVLNGRIFFLPSCNDSKTFISEYSSFSNLYINFEDERLLPCNAIKLRQLVDAFYVLYPEN